MECQKCGKGHDGSYGSGRFCSDRCKNKFNLQKIKATKSRVDVGSHRFGHLVALTPDLSVYDPDGRPRTTWKCLCDCGRERVVVTEKLRAGEVTNCCHKECDYHHPLHYDNTTESSFNSLLLNYKTNARKKKREFKLSKEDFRLLTIGECYYCGAPPLAEWRVTRVSGTKTDPYLFNGIDRVDSSTDYTLENCVTCCKWCNKMKMDMSIEDFIKRIQQVLIHWKGGNQHAGLPSS